MEVFQDYACYYNAFYQDKDYRKEAEQADSLLKKYGTNICRLINYGCGTGRHDICLTQMGYNCTGIDMSEDMIKIARKNAGKQNLEISFSTADIRKYEPLHKYDAVLSLFHVMSYQVSNKDIADAFRSARKALDKGGIFLFDVWYGPGVLSDKPVLRVKEVEDERNRMIRIARPVMHDRQNTVDVCYEVFVIDKCNGMVKNLCEVHKMRYFFQPEIELLLSTAGFELIGQLDCANLKETDYSSWTCYFIARAAGQEKT